MLKKILRSIAGFYYRNFCFSDSLMHNKLNGKYKVKYPDGNVSQPFHYKLAKNYRDLFGGEIIENF